MLDPNPLLRKIVVTASARSRTDRAVLIRQRATQQDHQLGFPPLQSANLHSLSDDQTSSQSLTQGFYFFLPPAPLPSFSLMISPA
jgi:hypothetical protein